MRSIYLFCTKWAWFRQNILLCLLYYSRFDRVWGMPFAINTVFLLLIYVSINTLATYLMKISPSVRSRIFIGGIFFQGVGFLILLWLIKFLPISMFIPTATGLLIVSNSFLGHLLLKEHISRYNILGYVFVIVGVCLVYFNFWCFLPECERCPWEFTS